MILKNVYKVNVNQLVAIIKNGKNFIGGYLNMSKKTRKKKTISTELAIQLWIILFQKDKKYMKLFDQWIKYCNSVKDKDMKVISRDLWELCYEFLKETESIDNYDDAGGSWPVAIDEFV